jgi:hypothetical protein
MQMSLAWAVEEWEQKRCLRTLVPIKNIWLPKYFHATLLLFPVQFFRATKLG